MGQLLISVLPLGLAAAVTPTLFALQILVVSGPNWQRRALAVTLGSGAVFAVIFALFLAGLTQLPDAGTGTTSPIAHWVELGSGVVLLGLAVWLLRPHPNADAKLEAKVRGYADHASPLVFAGLAAYMSVTDFSSLVVLIPALHLVTASAVPLVAQGVVVLILFGLVMVPLWVPPLAVRLAGQRGVHALNRLYAALMNHQLQVMGVVALLLGVLLVYRGFSGLNL